MNQLPAKTSARYATMIHGFVRGSRVSVVVGAGSAFTGFRRNVIRRLRILKTPLSSHRR